MTSFMKFMLRETLSFLAIWNSLSYLRGVSICHITKMLLSPWQHYVDLLNHVVMATNGVEKGLRSLTRSLTPCTKKVLRGRTQGSIKETQDGPKWPNRHRETKWLTCEDLEAPKDLRVDEMLSYCLILKLWSSCSNRFLDHFLTNFRIQLALKYLNIEWNVNLFAI